MIFLETLAAAKLLKMNSRTFLRRYVHTEKIKPVVFQLHTGGKRQFYLKADLDKLKGRK